MELEKENKKLTKNNDEIQIELEYQENENKELTNKLQKKLSKNG